MDYKKILKNILILVIGLFMLCAAVVIIIDPFFHYHKPLPGLKAVLNEKEYQCIGTIKNFDYDALIVGSSVCENYNNNWFDERFDVKSIKAVRSYGATADLCYFIDEAYKKHNIRKVFYNIDPGCLANEPYITFEETGCPMYLYDSNPFNDIEYLLNKDVLFEKIPLMVTKSFLGEYDEGNSYNWGQWKVFSKDQIMRHYIRKKLVNEMNPEDKYANECDANIELIEKNVIDHPETEFYFFIPPYSFFWWDNAYRFGDTDAYIYNMKICAKRLSAHDNVKFYYFLTNEEIVTNIDNYMDALHFSTAINYEIVNMLADEMNVVKPEDIDALFDESKIFAQKCVDEIILPYEDDMLVRPDD